MNVLVTGGAGQVASELQRQYQNFPEQNQNKIIFLNKHQLDIANASQLEEIVTTQNIHLVINTAAFTHVDLAEAEIHKAVAVNFTGAKHLAILCERLNIPLIHLSTDYIFDGYKNDAYLEDDLANPLSVYGQTKWEGEAFIRSHCKKHLIIRVSGVFSVYGSNFVKTILRLAKEKESISVISDNQIAPTSANQIAKMLLRICFNSSLVSSENSGWGTYHFCGDTAVSWYDYAKKILSVASLYSSGVKYILKEANIVSVTSSNYPTPAKRPQNSVLNCEKMLNIFNINQPALDQELVNVIQELSTR